MLAADVNVTGLAESAAWPDPILEVQWVVATVDCEPEDAGALVLEPVAAVPVPMLAVQSGAAVCVVAGLGLTLLTVVRAVYPVPIAADQSSLEDSLARADCG